MKKDWYTIKPYPHIGFKPKHTDRALWLEEYVRTPEKIVKHPFTPFIYRKSTKRKFRKEYNELGELKTEKRRVGGCKPRDLYYASHIDSLIYSYYSKKLSDKFEEKLKLAGLTEVVLAYRRIEDKSTNKGKCNIDFANDVFEDIINYSYDKFFVVTLDITSFFDNLCHNHILNSVKNVLDLDAGAKIDDDLFAVLKSIMRFSYVNEVELFLKFKDRIYVEVADKNGKKYIKRKKVNRLRFIKDQNAVSFCDKKEFYCECKKLIKQNKFIKKEGKIMLKKFGIPQGTPISATLANIYLYDFDNYVNNFINSINGTYKRYSDDIILIFPDGDYENVINSVVQKIQDSPFSLEIKDSKTQIFKFERGANGLFCSRLYGSTYNKDKNLEYLGFEFDGKIKKIKSSTLSGYYRKMNKSVRISKRYALNINSHNANEIFKHKLYKKFTIKGAGRKMKYLFDPLTKKNIKTNQHDWGNFITYAKKAHSIMKSDVIKKQYKNHWKIINNLIKI